MLATAIVSKPVSSIICAECRTIASDMYMLRDDVWQATGLRTGSGGGFLHLACVEKRLGRLLTLDDFRTESLANSTVRWAWARGKENVL
jgi:hypothetical protein